VCRWRASRGEVHFRVETDRMKLELLVQEEVCMMPVRQLPFEQMQNRHHLSAILIQRLFLLSLMSESGHSDSAAGRSHHRLNASCGRQL